MPPRGQRLKKRKILNVEDGPVPDEGLSTVQKRSKADVSSVGKHRFLEEIHLKRERCACSIAHFPFNKDRVKLLSDTNDIPEESQGILYWMSRDQRVQDNWAFLYAQYQALKCHLPLHVCFCLVPSFLNATIRHYDFMLKGLQQIESECQRLNISFHMLIGEASDVLPDFIQNNDVGGVVTDFSPLRISLDWVQNLRNKLPSNVTFCQVDAHNIVPCWKTSDKLEYAARTIRGKINGKLPEFLTEFPPLITHPFAPSVKSELVDWDNVRSSLRVDDSVPPVDWAVAGTEGSLDTLHTFCEVHLKRYDDLRNDPNENCVSNLSPWLHFGQLAAQRCCLEVQAFRDQYTKSVDAFLEETIVRRELADNFCYYNRDYDKIAGANEWAKKSLTEHRQDKREYVYSKQVLDEAKTHDKLWNAAQKQMVTEGKMHGFLRMYWAKKILEWTSSPEEALEIAIYLNDRYELDGRDPNGYVGCMWSIAGIHDQGWAERKIFGKIRYMNLKGCYRKFDVDQFVRKYCAS